MMKVTKLVIVGAGAAGIAASCRLLEHGMKDFVLLEAEDRIGGRIHTTDFCGVPVDLGAHWVHGEKNNVCYAMANQLNLLEKTITTVVEETTMFVDSNGKIIAPDKIAAITGMIFNIYENSTEKLKNYHGSYGDYFTTEFQKQVEQPGLIPKDDLPLAYSILDWFSKYEKSIDGSDSWFETSARGLTEYWECEGFLLWSWKEGGYSNILDILMKKFPDPSKELPIKERLHLNKEVVDVEWDSTTNGETGKVIVSCKDGTCFKAEHVILTVSLGVLKAQAKTLFRPSLPEYKLNAIEGLAIGTVDKMFLKFPHRWWPENIHAFALLWANDSEQDSGTSVNFKDNWLQEVFMFHDVDHHPLTLCGWVVGPMAQKMELMTDAEVCRQLMQLLNKFLGKSFSIPSPENFTRTKWAKNSHFGGSYSFYSMETERRGTSPARLAEPVCNSFGNQVLLFAGEATHDHYYSTVHGAIESGWREADRILQNQRLFQKSSL